MLILAVFLLFWTFYCENIFVHGNENRFSTLNTNHTQVWLKAVAQINNISQIPRIEIVQLGHEIHIPLENITRENRYLFKQNINKHISSYLYENQLNPSIVSNIYDPCHGILSSREAQQDNAGIYVYTNNQTSYGLGIILIEPTKSFQWFNGTKLYSFTDQSTLKNGTQLSLAFETMITYNANSDLILYNEKINDIIQQMNISITDENINDLQTFISMGSLSCRRHQKIVNDDLRLLTFACITKVTFKCPLKIGSTCWLEEKRISNIQLNINSLAFVNKKTITVRIDV